MATEEIPKSISTKDLVAYEEQIPVEKKSGCIKERHIFAMMGFLGFAVMYFMRINLSMAIVAMVTTGTNSDTTDTQASGTCPYTSSGNSSSSSTTTGEFDWDEQTQGIILGAFFYGYIVTQIPAGFLSGIYGGKILFLIGMGTMSIFTLLSPIAARTNVILLIVCRAMEGLGGGFLFPAMHSMLGKWCPPMERSKLASFIYSGCQLGTVIGIPVSGLLCDTTFMGGWPSAFYVFGIVGVIWTILGFFLIYESPSAHPRISDIEKEYIITSLGDTVQMKTPPVPWKAILKSKAVWAIVAVHFGQSWTFFTLITELPTYLSNIFHLTMSNNSIVSALPYLAMWIFAYFFSWFADYLRSHNILSTVATRKLSQAVSQIGPIIALVIIAFIGCDYTVVIIALIVGIGINGALYSGYFSNHIDLSPNFAGTLLGFSSCFANCAGIIAPLVVGALTNGQQTLTQWQIVFLIAAGICVVSDIIFLIFAQAEVQRWNRPRGNSVASSRVETKEEIQDALVDIATFHVMCIKLL